MKGAENSLANGVAAAAAKAAGGPVVPKLLLNCDEAAAALSISRRLLWSLTAGGEIPVVRIGRTVRYDPDDLRDWIDAQKSSGPGAYRRGRDFETYRGGRKKKPPT